ncbi:gag-pol polyprotein [Trifolium medium]|uniref:Gag-pol polyprotein n=1 Tax=Trifolium medium TaxID=97028 RepID=A0A392LYW8_9FABA|nr:gag-pol polyprotein [Trifolium medium]
MCVNFTDLNKACPKDPYPLPSIDRLIDSASGYKTLSFMDAYSRYNQIKMNVLDAPRTAFMSNTCNYHYKVMPFCLKNVGATYQRLMDRVFAQQIGKNIEVYIDDMVVKTAKESSHHEDLEDILASVRKYNMRLNPAKCSFGVHAGKFLGFMLTNRGIEANPEKCQAIIDMRSPTSVKKVQQLTGRIAALSKFLSCVGEKAFHIFATLKNGERFSWTDKCEEAFQQLKQFLASPPILTLPQPGKVFQGAEIRYQKIEQLALAVVVTSRRLRQYFQSHKVTLKTDYPIKYVLKKSDLAGRMVAWAVELSEYDITFVPRGNIKSQILTDFILELSSPPEEASVQPWTLSVDGSSNLRGSGAGVVLEGPDGVLVEQSLRFAFKASNNQAEYEALIAAMKLAREMEVKDLKAKSDSQLVTSQVSGEFQAKDPQLVKYLEQNEKLPDEKEEATRVRKMSAHYTMIGDRLYKIGFSSPMLLCVGEIESRRILSEIHNGSCGSYIGARSLAGKVTRAGFFWPTLLCDANSHVRSCDKCQRHADLHHAPSESLKSVMSTWPFYMWGVDILGPFPTSQGQAKFLLVAVDYFTKWIEAEPVATISSDRVKKFYWKNLICRFGLPKYIVSDNGTQFTMEHPQANGQAESANKVILKAIKRRLEGKDKSWVEHLLPILWSYHTTTHSSTGETPFKMVYGTDAMIPAEINPPSWRRATLTVTENSEALKENLDLLEKVREAAHFREFAVKQRATQKYNTRVIAREFREGDLVLKRLMGRDKGGKLSPNWEGPFRIQEVFGGGAYRLETLKGEMLPGTWNVTNLRFYYS